jgi:hypothetical protein
MSFNSGFRRRSVLGPVLAVVLLIWFVLGAVCADYRHYLDGTATCASVRTIAITIVAGPLNYAGANPKVNC